MTASPLGAVLTTCRIDPVLFVWVELWESYGEARVRSAVMEAVALDYGAFYDQVCFESGTGTQFCRAKPGARPGQSPDFVASALASAVEAIRAVHSYEEPVIYVTEGSPRARTPKMTRRTPTATSIATKTASTPENPLTRTKRPA